MHTSGILPEVYVPGRRVRVARPPPPRLRSGCPCVGSSRATLTPGRRPAGACTLVRRRRTRSTSRPPGGWLDGRRGRCRKRSCVEGHLPFSVPAPLAKGCAAARAAELHELANAHAATSAPTEPDLGQTSGRRGVRTPCRDGLLTRPRTPSCGARRFPRRTDRTGGLVARRGPAQVRREEVEAAVGGAQAARPWARCS